MKQFEYCVRDCVRTSAGEIKIVGGGSEVNLDVMGLLGWELVNAMPGTVDDLYVLFFKREASG